MSTFTMTTTDEKPKQFQYWVNADEAPVRTPYDKVTEFVLNSDKETGNETIIQTLHAGYQGEGAYGHDFTEEVYVLSGTSYCGTAKKWLRPGDYICRTPGMIHGPFTVKEDGEDFTALLVNTRTYTGGPIPKGLPQFLYETQQKQTE